MLQSQSAGRPHAEDIQVARVPDSSPLHATRTSLDHSTGIPDTLVIPRDSPVPSISPYNVARHHPTRSSAHGTRHEASGEPVAARNGWWSKLRLMHPFSPSLHKGHALASGAPSSPRRQGTGFLGIRASVSLPSNLQLAVPQGNHEDADARGDLMYQAPQRRTGHASTRLPAASSSFGSLMPYISTFRSIRRSPLSHDSLNDFAQAHMSTMNPRSTIHEHEFHASTRLREYKVTPSTQSLQLPQVHIPQLRSGDTDIDTTDHDVDSNHSSPNDDSTMPKPSRPTSNLVMPSRISATSSHHIHPRSSFEIESRQPDEAHHRVEVIDLEVDGTRPDSLASSQSSLGIPLVQQPAVSSTSSSPLFFSHPHFYRSILPDSPYSYARHDPHNGAPLGLHPIPHPHPHFTPRYRFMGTIGQGSYGKVLLGYRDDDPHEEIRAVKVMPKRHIRRFGVNEIVKELTALRLVAQTMEYSSLEDGGLSGCQMDGDKEGIQFLQKLVESFQDPGYVFIVLEYHPTTLANPETASRFCLVEADTSRHSGLSTSVSLPLSFPESITSSSAYYSRDQVMTALRLLAAELSLGLLFLHNHGLVHQDIKPANIMISADGHAVIGDFGAATALPVLSEAESQIAEYLSARVPSLAVSPPPQSRYGVIILQPEDTVSFTPLYAAPEILERNGEGLLVYDERVDWWSLGVLLHELSTGEVPFRMTGGGGAPLRRSDGDASISYGLLEKLSIHEYGKDGCPMRDSHFAQFVKDLLVEDPEYRLAGSGVKHHAFFSPIENDWEEILALQCPPCPHPTVTTVDTSDTSLHFTPTKGAEGNGEDIHRDADVSEEERHDSLDSGSTTTSSRGSTVSISSSNAAATARTSASANDTTSRTEEIPVNIHTSDTHTHTAPANPLDVDSLFNGAGLRITQLRKVDNLPCEKDRLAWRSLLQFGAGQYGVFTAASSSPSSSSSGLSWPLSPSPPPSPRYTGPQHSRRSSYDYGHGYSHEFGRSRSRRVGYRRGAGYSPGYRHSRLGFGFGFGVGGYAGRSYLEGLAEVIEEEEGACEGESEGEERRFKEQKLSSDEDPEPWHDDSGLGFLPLTTPPRHKNLKKTSSLSKEVVGDVEVVCGNGGGSVEIETGLADGASSVSFAGVFGGGGVYDDERRDSVDYEYDSTSESDYEDEDDEGHGGEYGGDAKENERDNDRMFEDRRKEDSQLGDEDHEEELGPDDSISVEKEVGSSGEYTQCVAILKKEDTESVKRSSVSTITGHAEGRESGEWERSERSGGERTEEENQTGGSGSHGHRRNNDHRKHQHDHGSIRGRDSKGYCTRSRHDSSRDTTHDHHHNKHKRRASNAENSLLRSEFNDSGLFIPVDLDLDAGALPSGVVVSRHIYDQLEACLDLEDGLVGRAEEFSMLAGQVTRLRTSVGIRTGTRGMEELMGEGSSNEGSDSLLTESVARTSMGERRRARRSGGGGGSGVDSSFSSGPHGVGCHEFPTELRNLEPQIWDPRQRRRFEKDIEVVFDSASPSPTLGVTRRRARARTEGGRVEALESPLRIEKYDSARSKEEPVHEWTLEEKITISVLEAMERRDNLLRQQHYHHHRHHHCHRPPRNACTINSRNSGYECPQCHDGSSSYRSPTPASQTTTSTYSSSSNSSSGWARRYNATAHMFYRFGVGVGGLGGATGGSRTPPSRHGSSTTSSCNSSASGRGGGRFLGLGMKSGRRKTGRSRQQRKALTNQVRQVIQRVWKKIAFW